MSMEPSFDEQIGGPQMDSKAIDIIREAKAIRAENKITYITIMEQMEELDPTSVVSLSTLRRFFRDGSETKASSFNYEEVLLPIITAMRALAQKPQPESEHDKELEGYKAVIRVQNEELDRLLELKEHLDNRVDFLLKQIEKKDELIKKLMEKVL